MGTAALLGGWIGVCLFVFAIVLAIAWIILPFALIGTKPLLRQLVDEMKRHNELLESRLPAPNRGQRD